MKRRRFLASAAGGMSATAGCLDALSRETGTDPPATDGSSAKTGRPTVRPTTKVVRKSLGTTATVGDVATTVTTAGVWRRTTHAGTDRTVVAASDRQYLVFQVSTSRTTPNDPTTAPSDTTTSSQSAGSAVSAPTSTAPPSPTDLSFGLSLDGVTYTRSFPTGNSPDGSTTLAVPVPTGIRPSNGAVMWYGPDGTTVRWSLLPGHFDQLARTPRFVLESLEATPDESQLSVTMSVSNQGSRAGRFLAEVGTQSVSQGAEVSFGVPLDETVIYHTSAPLSRPDREQATVVLQWGDTVHERTVDL
ncbi:hypothetical protein [Haloarchaeobius sp. DT45]|uniref:hypothetical protein n=1 Tax=Haloarchaeobius sp. DT45 TaxID=3446116 RepID=UPI003F6A9CD9